MKVFVAIVALLIAACSAEAEELCYKDAVRACKTTVSKQGKINKLPIITFCLSFLFCKILTNTLINRSSECNPKLRCPIRCH